MVGKIGPEDLSENEDVTSDPMGCLGRLVLQACFKIYSLEFSPLLQEDEPNLALIF